MSTISIDAVIETTVIDSTVQTSVFDSDVITTEITAQVIAQGGKGPKGDDGIYGVLVGEHMTFVSGLTWSISQAPVGYVLIFDGSAFMILGIDYTQSGQDFTFVAQNPTYPFAVYATGGAGLGGGRNVYEELTGVKNGTTGFDGNAVFTLSHIPFNPAMIELLNRTQMIQGIDYTYSVVIGVATITFSAGSIPLAADHPFARYDY